MIIKFCLGKGKTLRRGTIMWTPSKINECLYEKMAATEGEFFIKKFTWVNV